MAINPTIVGGVVKPAYDVNKEIERTKQVITDRTNQGLDLTSQLAHYKNLTGKAYQAPTAQAQQPNMNQSIESMFGQSQTYLNNMFNQQKESQLSALRAQRDQAVGNVNAQKTKVAPQYQQMRNQTDVTNLQNVQKLREIMAANGLNATGENVSANVAMNNERVNSLNKLNLQERETLNDYDRQITDLMNPAQEQQLIAAIEAQRAQALYDARNRAEDVGYNRYRDGVADTRYADELAYGRGRDTIADQRYNQEWTYNVGRDKVADQRYADETKYNRGQDQKQWDYQVGRDKVADARWKTEFEEDKRRFGIENALQRQVQLGNLSVNQAQLALSQSREARNIFESDRAFNADQVWKQKEWDAAQQEAKNPKSENLSPYTSQLNKMYLTKDYDGNYILDPKKEEGLYKSIIGLNLNDNDTIRLLGMYGIDYSKFTK